MILCVGMIIGMVWMITIFLVDKKKKNILCVIGGIACIALLLYTRQWKVFLLSAVMGGLMGGGGISRRGVEHAYNEFGLMQSIIVFSILITYFMMMLVAATPDIEWWAYNTEMITGWELL